MAVGSFCPLEYADSDMQLELFAPRNDSTVSLTCQHPEIGDVMNAYCGFPKGFTGHDWCKKHKPRWLLADGTEIPCSCECHA